MLFLPVMMILFSVAKATLESLLSFRGVVMLNLGCGYVQKGVVMLSMVWLCSKRCGYVVTLVRHTSLYLHIKKVW